MRGASGLVVQDGRVLGALVVALALALPAAMAEPGTASLTARGPLDLEGPVDLVGHQAGLVLRDPGTASWSRVELSLRALHAVVEDITIQEACFVPGNTPHVAHVAVRDFSGHEALSILGDLPGLQSLPGPALPNVPPIDVPSLPGAPEDAAHAVLDGVRSTVDTARGLVQGGPSGGIPVASASCMQTFPSSDSSRVALENFSLQVRPVDEAYTIAFDGTDKDHPGEVSLTTLDGQLDMVRGGDDVQPVGDSETELREPAPAMFFGSGLLRSTVSAGTGTIRGAGELLIYRSSAWATGTTHDDQAFRQQYKTGETRSAGPVPGLDIQQHRTLEFLRVTFTDGDGRFRSPGELTAYASSAHMDLDGTLGMPAAWGHVDVGNQTFVLDGAPARLSGQLSFHVTKAEPHAAAHTHGDDQGQGTPQMAIDMDGDVSRVETAHVAQGFAPGVAQTAAAVSGLALLGGALAYFWPAIKFGATALYTRIPRDAVLMHGARERIYRLVKDEPGIHAHEVAERLDLGWGTTVYHLKLLEKNQLLVARHEGRYKRFFITGDARIQHKDAIALLRNGTASAIAGQVAKQPGLIQKDVCLALGLSPSLASWHLQRLEASGLVKAERWGRTVRYTPGPAWDELNGATLGAVPQGMQPPAQPSATIATPAPQA